MGNLKKNGSQSKTLRINPQKECPELGCEWKECCFKSSSQFDFNDHVARHIGQVEIVVDENEGEMYECCWSDCGYNCQNPGEIIRHIKYHAFHTRLKAVGAIVKEKKSLPNCAYVESGQTIIPTQTEALVCLWEGCGKENSGQGEHVEHVVKEHLIPLNEKKMSYNCQWADCKTGTSTKSKLMEHVRVHTGEKVVACPTCGNMFSNLTKFADHCNRQMLCNDYQCTHCLGYFPTERILTHHMRQHVHHYKCSFCDMTCNTPAILATHIRYRHLSYKYYSCPTCSSSFKSQSDLRSHALSHDPNRRFACNEPDCDFTAKTQQTLIRHFEKIHSENKGNGGFSCHLCDKKYSRGAILTKHLLSIHGVNKPYGYSRFVYRYDEDGCYRLQTTRLESLEVTADIEKSFQMKEEWISKRHGHDDDDDDDDEEGYDGVESECIHTIAIDVLDESGKIVKSETVMAGKIFPPNAKVVAVAP